MLKFLVLKQFAIGSQIYGEKEILELSEADSKALVADGKIQPYTATKFEVAALDTEAISAAVTKGLAALAPRAPQAPLDFGQMLQDLSQKKLNSIELSNKNINIGTTTQGGYATTIYTDPMIDVDLIEQSGIASLARRTNLTGTNNIYKKNVVNSMGNAPAVTAESATINASQPTITQFSFTLQKLTYRMDVTEEALADTGALVSEVSGQVPEEFSKYVENGIINGVGPFTGIIGDTNTVVVAKEAGQTDGTLVAENFDKMFSSAKRPNQSTWIMGRSSYTAVQGLEDGSGQRIFQGPTGIAGNLYGTIKGRPIVVSDYSPALGEEGDVIFANMRKYDIVSKGGLRMATSAHILFLTDQTCFKFAYRTCGKPTGLKLTATDGTEISDFVVTAQRGS